MDAANAIFKAAYEAVLPHRLIQKALSIGVDRTLSISATGRRYQLNKNVYVAAFGKAASGMSRAVEDILHEDVVGGVVSMPYGTVNLFQSQGLRDLLPRDGTRLRYYEGAMNNLPDENAHQAAIAITRMVCGLSSSDLLLVLISGGGSALLPCPPAGVTLAAKTALIKFLSKRGADITELNTVRQRLSQLKGGGLARLAARGSTRVISLIISDVVGDPLDIVASGPTVQRKSSAADAVAIVRKYAGDRLEELKSILDFLGNVEEDAQENIFDRVENVIIGNNRTALEAARCEAQRRQFLVDVISDKVIGNARDVARSIVQHLDGFLSTNHQKRCWLWGGETTVRVEGDGRGGRNQEMVLSFMSEVNRLRLLDKASGKKFAFLSAGTDGQDGPTDAAGAAIDSEALETMTQEDVKKIEDCLERNDSYNFFDRFHEGRCHVKCGLTGTNVMDVQILLVE